MANSDIRLMLSFQTHPKTKKLRLKLGNDGLMSFVWLMMFAAANKPDGILTDMDKEDIALAADYQGDPEEFVDVLLAVKYLDFDGENHIIHDWAENNPWAAGASKRKEKATHAANVRHHGKSTPKTEKQQLTPKNNATSKTEQCNEHDLALLNGESSNAPSPFPSFPSPSPGGGGSQKEGENIKPPDKPPPPRLKVEKEKRDYSTWKPAGTTIDRLKLNCPATADHPGITDDFIDGCLLEFLTYAEEHYRPDQLQAKFIKSVTSDFKRQQLHGYRVKAKARFTVPKNPDEIMAWAEKNDYPIPRPGESTPAYATRIEKLTIERQRTAN